VLRIILVLNIMYIYRHAFSTMNIGRSDTLYTSGAPARHAAIRFSAPSGAEVKNAWSHTSIPPLGLHGVVLSYEQGQFYLYLERLFNQFHHHRVIRANNRLL